MCVCPAPFCAWPISWAFSFFLFSFLLRSFFAAIRIRDVNRQALVCASHRFLFFIYGIVVALASILCALVRLDANLYSTHSHTTVRKGGERGRDRVDPDTQRECSMEYGCPSPFRPWYFGTGKCITHVIVRTPEYSSNVKLLLMMRKMASPNSRSYAHTRLCVSDEWPRRCVHASCSLSGSVIVRQHNFRQENEIYVMENEENGNRKEFDTLQVEFGQSCIQWITLYANVTLVG